MFVMRCSEEKNCGFLRPDSRNVDAPSIFLEDVVRSYWRIMAKFKVSQEKEAELLNWMSSLGIREEDIVERFVRGSGAGGQKINKTSSTVQLLHNPSGIEIKCQKSRSQALNRYLARRELCTKLEAALLGKKSREQQEREKIRRQKRRRSRRAKEKILADKNERSKTKASRQKIRRDYEN